MGEGSAFRYARIAAQAEEELLKLFDNAETATQPEDAENGVATAIREEETSCAA